jgi:hypothetical protein
MKFKQFYDYYMGEEICFAGENCSQAEETQAR